MGYGNEGFLGIAKQSSWGTASTSFHYVPFMSEGLPHNVDVLMPESIQSRYDEPDVVEGLTTVQGDVVMELNPIDGGAFLLGACGSVTVTEPLSGTVFSHKFQLGQSRFDENAALIPYTVQIYRGVDEAFQYTDGQVNALEINIAAGGFARLTAGLLCRTASLMTKGTASYHSADAFTWNQASLSMAGSAITDFEEVTVSINNALEGLVLLDGTKKWARIQRNGFREIRVNGTVDLPNLDEYDQFVSQTERRLIITFTRDEISSGYYSECVIDVPNFRYDTFPVNIGGPGRISVGFAGRAQYDTTSSYALEITLQNSLSAY